MIADVVIPTWNARDLLPQALDALTGEPCRIIVVDNGSDDGTVAMLRDRYPGVLLLALERNLGFGRAVNAGAARATGDAIVLVNNDVVVEPGFVAAITLPLADPSVGMVAGLTTIPGTDAVDGFGIELDRALAAYNRGARRERPGGSRCRAVAPPRTAGARSSGWAGSTSGCSPTGRTSTSASGCAPPAGAPPRRRPRAASTSGARPPGSARAGSASSRVSRAGSCCGAGASWRHGRRRARCSPRRWSSAGASYGTAPPCRCAPVSVAGEPPVGERRRLPDGVVDPAISWREALRRLASGR